MSGLSRSGVRKCVITRIAILGYNRLTGKRLSCSSDAAGPRGERIAPRLRRKNYSGMLTFAYRGERTRGPGFYIRSACLIIKRPRATRSIKTLSHRARSSRGSFSRPFRDAIRRRARRCVSVDRSTGETSSEPATKRSFGPYCSPRGSRSDEGVSSARFPSDRWNLIPRRV